MSLATLAFATLVAAPQAAAPAAAVPPAQKPVSFYKEVRPLLTAQCAGCHQPAKAGGKIVLTSHAALLAALRHDEPILVAGKPDESLLLTVLRPSGAPGDASAKPPKMPKSRPPLTDKQVDLIRHWIEQGASDDTPAAATELFTMERPPVYQQQPVVTSLDFSPDGTLLAISGYHEVLLYEVGNEGGALTGAGGEAGAAPVEPPVQLAARLVGLSERIQSALFSPDGKELLVVGGSPARLGEVAFWNVAERKLRLSVPVGADTLYGGSWSPDGKLVAFGGGDNSVRALDATSGEQLFFNAASEDLALDTAFSSLGTHLVSVGRDRSLKLFEVGTQQFVDNITSITPGALKGGLMAVDRRPGALPANPAEAAKAEVLLIGGSDGTPKTYQMFRTKDRQIGDDYNLVKAYAPLAGRLFAAEWSPDGARFVVGSSSDGKGEVRLYAVDQVEPVWSLPTAAAIYSVSWRPGTPALVAAGGFDGQVELIDATTGQVVRSFAAAPLSRPEGRP